MSRFLTLLTVVFALAILQAAVAALLLTLILVAIFYIVTRPRETLAVVGTLMLFGLVSTRPITCVAILAIGFLAAVAFGARKPPAADRRLPPSGRALQRLDGDLLG